MVAEVEPCEELLDPLAWDPRPDRPTLRRLIAMRILILTGDAGEAQEIYYAKYRLEEEGWHVDIAAPEKRAFLSVVHDFEPGFDTYTEKPGYRVQADLGLNDVDASAYHGLVLPGGR